MSLEQQQKRLLLACIGAAIVSGVIMYIILAPSKSDKAASASLSGDTGPIKTPSATVGSNELWMQKISHDSDLQGKKLEVIEKVMHKLGQPATPNDADQFAHMKQELAALKQQIAEQSLNLKGGEGAPATPPVKEKEATFDLLKKHELALQGGLYTVKTRIPPGAYVKAVLLSAVDVGVGVNVSADPQPALLRLLGGVRLLNNT